HHAVELEVLICVDEDGNAHARASLGLPFGTTLRCWQRPWVLAPLPITPRNDPRPIPIHAVAWMIQNGETSGTLYINHPDGQCDSCPANLNKMLAPGSRLTIIGPTGQRNIFTGIAR